MKAFISWSRKIVNGRQIGVLDSLRSLCVLVSMNGPGYHINGADLNGEGQNSVWWEYFPLPI